MEEQWTHCLRDRSLSPLFEGSSREEGCECLSKQTCRIIGLSLNWLLEWKAVSNQQPVAVVCNGLRHWEEVLPAKMSKQYKQTVQLLWIQLDNQTLSYKCRGSFSLCFQFMIAMTQTSTVPRHHISKHCCNLDRQGLSTFCFVGCKVPLWKHDQLSWKSHREEKVCALHEAVHEVSIPPLPRDHISL